MYHSGALTRVSYVEMMGALQILNPGSVYGVTGRDSATCATLILPTRAYRVFDLRSGKPIDLPVTLR